MVNINLLPPEIKLKIKRGKKSANIFAICLVAIVLVAVGGVILSSLKSAILQPRLDSTKSQIDKANADLGNFDKLETQALFINDRAKIAKTIEEKRAVWSQILQDLINSVPQDVQFLSLSVDLDKSPNFVLQGNTTSEREVILFKDKLENSKFFKDVSFKSSSKTEGTTEGNLLSFTLEFNIEQYSAETKSTSGASTGNKEVK